MSSMTLSAKVKLKASGGAALEGPFRGSSDKPERGITRDGMVTVRIRVLVDGEC
jgi:hypothetical protein